MNLLQKLSNFLMPKPPSETGYYITVKCDRCGERIEARINLSNDLSLGDDGAYWCRKVLVGSQRCYQPIEVNLKFNTQRQLLDRQISGGQFVSEA